MKKILSLILALVAIATTAKAQTKFGIEVGGVQVTSANLSNITGGDIKSGTVKYNPTNRKLTLTNVKIERSGSGRRGIYFYNEKVGDLTIVFEGTNTITTDVSCALRCEAPTTLVLSANSTTTFTATKEVEAIYVTKGIELEIQGSDTGTGSLTVKANKEYAIEGDGKETIRFTKAPIVTLNGVQGNLVNLRNVIFNASSTAKTQVTLKAVGSAYSQVQNVTVWTEQGYSHIETPAGAKFDSTAKTIMLNGKKVANQDVVINEDVIPLNSSSKIPDANFRAYLKETFAGGRNYLTHAEAQQVTEIDVYYNKKIANLKGIEFFTALEKLDCSGNQLKSLDVSKNTALKVLSCYKNQLKSLDVSKNTALTMLYCYDNQLTSLNVSGCTALEYLDCENNQLTSLNVSGCTALKKLYCYDNQLTSLNVSGCTALTELYCYDNQLTSLDVTKNTALKYLYCYGNQIKDDKMQALVNSLPKVSSGNLYVINTKDNNEGNVITKPQVAIAKNRGWKVYDRNGGYPPYPEYAGSDPGIAINDTNFPDANFRSYVSANTIDKDTDGYLSDAEIAKVTSIDVSKKNIAKLKGIEFFTALAKLYCSNNQLTSLDVSGCTALKELQCHNNQLTSLDVSKNTALTELWCNKNQLTSLDVSKNTDLRVLFCSGNQLSSLDVSNNTALTNLRCSGNQLTSLDVSKNTALKQLYCYNNQLTSLDVSQNTKLNELDCDNNQLTALDVSKNTDMIALKCHNNQLTALDVSENSRLQHLECYSNQIKGAAMQALVNSLPWKKISFPFYVIDTKDSNEGNVITKSQVAIAKENNWKVYDYNGGSAVEYEGSDDPTTGLTAVESGQLTVDSWYSIDGKKLQGEPTKKGVYIIKGKKVKR